MMRAEDGHDPLQDTVRRHRQRRAGAGDKDGSFAKDLAWMGGIAWLIVVPLLLGAFLGRTIDRLLGTGIAVTAALIVVGACLGGYLAWRRMGQP